MSKRRPKTDDFVDDGRTIVDMNVEGMPWYHRSPDQPEGDEAGSGDHYKMTKEEQRMYTWAAIKAGLVIVLIFALVFGAFIAFCDFVWFN